MTQLRAEGTFTVTSFDPVPVTTPLEVSTNMAVGVATLTKDFAGGVQGHSSTLFTGARQEETGAGTYVALESFEGSLEGVAGAFNFIHVASTHGTDRYGDAFSIVDASGTGALAAISGGGGLTVDDDGTHRIWFDYTLDG